MADVTSYKRDFFWTPIATANRILALFNMRIFHYDIDLFGGLSRKNFTMKRMTFRTNQLIIGSIKFKRFCYRLTRNILLDEITNRASLNIKRAPTANTMVVSNLSTVRTRKTHESIIS